MNTVFSELLQQTKNITRQLSQPWGLCDKPESGEYTCEERIIQCKGECGQ